MPSQNVTQNVTTCLWCGKEFAPNHIGRARKYCGHACRQRAYESRKYNIGELWEQMSKYSDCYLCQEPLDWDQPQSICTDHMIATVHGGRTVPENLRPVHIVCNLRKGSTLIKAG